MFNISKLVNRITDRGQGNGRDGSGENSASFMDSEEQHSAEGFLCPPCMRAFPSAEALEEHYNATHINNEDNLSPSDSQSSTNGDIQILRQEIQNLQSSLNIEKNTSAELQKAVSQMQAGFQSRDEDNLSVNSQARELETSNSTSLLTSEVSLLRQQLIDSLELVSQTKKEKNTLSEKLLHSTAENDSLKSDVISLQSQLKHKNSVDDAEVLKQELVSVQRMMDQMSLEKDREIARLNMQIKFLNTESNLPTVEDKTQELEDCMNKNAVLQQKYQEKEVELDQSNISLKDFQRRCEGLTEEINDFKYKYGLQMKETADLKEIVRRQEEHQAELYNKIEGGEGAKAAVEGLKNENEILKQNLESAQITVSDALEEAHNLQKKLAKNENEHLKQAEAYKIEQNGAKAALEELKKENQTYHEKLALALKGIKKLGKEIEIINKNSKQLELMREKFMLLYKEDKEDWISRELLLNDKLKQQEEELNSASQKQTDLLKASESKDSELQSLQLLIENNKQEISELNNELTNQTKDKNQQNELVQKLEGEITKLRDTVTLSDGLLQEQRSYNEKLLKEIEIKGQEYNTTSLLLEKSQAANKNIQETLSSAEQDKIKIEESYCAKLKTMESELKEKTESLKSTTDKLEKAKKSSLDSLEKLKAELELSKQELQSKKHELEGLQVAVQDERLRMEEKEAKLQVLQVQTDEILTDKIDLEKRVKSNEEEKSLLLERCLSGESEVEELRDTIKTIQRKLDDSHAALQELGRENQSLQMESAKLQGRKWADDSVVANCFTCDKEFTLTIRKHHCRHCGQIFCNDCSSRNAAVPSCKKPARVCDACYQELMSK